VQDLTPGGRAGSVTGTVTICPTGKDESRRGNRLAGSADANPRNERHLDGVALRKEAVLGRPGRGAVGGRWPTLGRRDAIALRLRRGRACRDGRGGLCGAGKRILLPQQSCSAKVTLDNRMSDGQEAQWSGNCASVCAARTQLPR
jgi:hypothetical protein